MKNLRHQAITWTSHDVDSRLLALIVEEFPQGTAQDNMLGNYHLKLDFEGFLFTYLITMLVVS